MMGEEFKSRVKFESISVISAAHLSQLKAQNDLRKVMDEEFVRLKRESILLMTEIYKRKDDPLMSPPKTAEFFLLLIPKKGRENLVGDLEEEYYERVLPEFGLKAAQKWYCWQVTYSVVAFIGSTVKDLMLFWRTSK